MNPFYNAMRGARMMQMPNPQNIMQMLQQFKQNPMQFIMKTKYNIPANAMSNPEAMVNHLVQSGQISQEQLENAKHQIDIWQKQAGGQDGSGQDS